MPPLNIYEILIISIFPGMLFFAIGLVLTLSSFESKPIIANTLLTIIIIVSIIIPFKTFSSLNHSRVMKEKIETILSINEDFLNSGKTVNSLSEAKDFKIISNEQISTTEDIASFSFQGRSLSIYIKDKKYEECLSIIPQLYEKLTSNSEATIYVNGLPFAEVTRSKANLSYECSKKEISIESTF